MSAPITMDDITRLAVEIGSGDPYRSISSFLADSGLTIAQIAELTLVEVEAPFMTGVLLGWRIRDEFGRAS